MALLGKYYSHKIKAATYLAIFRETLQKEWHTKTIEELNSSAGYWRHYASLGLSNYHNPLWTNRVGYVDWKENFQWSLYEIPIKWRYNESAINETFTRGYDN